MPTALDMASDASRPLAELLAPCLPLLDYFIPSYEDARRDGTLIALRGHARYDIGAYARPNAVTAPRNACHSAKTCWSARR